MGPWSFVRKASLSFFRILSTTSTTTSLMLTKLFPSKATYPNNIVIPPTILRHPTYYNILTCLPRILAI